MAIYAKITIQKRGTDIRGEYIALLNSGAKLKPMSPDMDFIPLPHIIVPPEVARELKVQREDLTEERGRYSIDKKGLYKVCLYDLEDNPVVCLDTVLLIIENDLDEILLTYEFLSVARIDLKPSIHAWVFEDKVIKSIFAVKRISEIDKRLLRYTPYREFLVK